MSYPLLSIILCDLDGLKRINDEYGHLAGDHVLRLFAARMKSALRDKDLVGRYGGDEFIILSFSPIDTAKQIAGRIQNHISNQGFNLRGMKFSLTTSMGLTDAKKEDENITGIIWRADQAMKTAKQQGGNKIIVKTD